MKDTVLILTNSRDGIHTDIIMNKLHTLGSKVFRCDVDRFSSGEITINFFANADAFGFKMISENQSIDSKDLKSIWYRRPNQFNLEIKDPAQKKYAEAELSHFLEGLWLATCDVFWLNHPGRLELARKKVRQLQLAREIGFNIPRTIITNDPATVEDFLKDCEGKIIFKAIYHELFEYEKTSFNVPTTLINEKHLGRLALIKKQPSLFQEYIDKQYELRVTVVGKEIFGVRINSQENEATAVDWRCPNFIDMISHVKSDLPDEIAARCFLMNEALGLEFGAFDFVVNEEGKVYFLEVNPNGQWYWLEHLTGVLISDAIATILHIGRIEGR